MRAFYNLIELTVVSYLFLPLVNVIHVNGFMDFITSFK